jgi:predicted nuclease with TOPRIM domain
LGEEKDDALNKLNKKGEEYKEKLQNATQTLQDDITAQNAALTISNQMIDSLKAEQASINDRLESANGHLSSKIDECIELQKKIGQLEEELEAVEIVSHTNSPKVEKSFQTSTGYDKVINYLHDSFDPMTESALLDNIVKTANIGRTVARKIISDLIDENILEKHRDGTVHMTKAGIQKIIDKVEAQEILEIPF